MSSNDTELVRPFKISISDDDISDLKHRLTNTRWADAETPDDWSQGLPLAYAMSLRDYWLNDYDWREREAYFNEFDQFLTEIDGLDIHFIHQPSKVPGARPLLITHGWPGSVVEFHKVIGPLTDPVAHGGRAEDAFHVVCPSLPGYGFSAKPTSTGWGVEKICSAWDTLMCRLGYDRYFAQGGDWGSAVTTGIGRQNIGHCAGIHVNMPTVGATKEALKNPSEKDTIALKAAGYYAQWGAGYSKQQATRPQTLGYGLVDSPMGQAAWVIEKFYEWTDCQGDPENVLTRQELIDNVMFYWLGGNGASSARLYWESFGTAFSGAGTTVALPTGCSIFPKEIVPAPRSWAEKLYTNIVYWNELDKGGHFAAFEQPELYIGEVRRCFGHMTL